MNFNPATTFSAILFIGALAGLYVLVFGHRKHLARKSGVRSPFVEDFLRLPGHTARLQRLAYFDELTESYNQFLLLSVLLVFSSLFIHSLLGAICLVVAIAGVAFTLKNAWSLFATIQAANLRCDGEEYTGQELNYLWAQGASVYHDIPHPGGNIDHIVIGNDKVLVVESYPYYKKDAGNNSENSNWQVEFNGETLQFPAFETREPIENAIRNAQYLKRQLLENCEVDFQVMPVVAIPGWHVKISTEKRAEILVINPRRGAGLKAWLGKTKDSKARKVVSTYLSTVARSIPPRSKRTDSNASKEFEFWLSPRFKNKILND